MASDLVFQRFNWFALPPLLVGLGVLLLGLATLLRERGSRLSLLFVIITASIGGWLLASGGLYAAVDPAVARDWVKLHQTCVYIIPAAIYHFAEAVANREQRNRLTISLAWLGSGLFVLAAWTGDGLVGPLYQYAWGYYPRYGWPNLLFLMFFGAMLLAGLRRYWQAYRQGAPDSLERQRAQALMVAFSIGYLGSLDYLPAYAVPLYPLGFLPLLVFLILVARAVWRYRLVDITPALAANQIIETMQEALLVFDQDGAVRLVNRAAAELLGLDPQHPNRDRWLPAAVENLLPAEQVQALLRTGRRQIFELGYAPPRRPGELGQRRLTLSMSATVMRDGPLVSGVVCVARDITERRQAEAALQREAARSAALVRAAQRLSGQLNLEAVLLTICAETANALNVPIATVSLFNPASDAFEHAQAVGLTPELAARIQPLPRSVHAAATQRGGLAMSVPDPATAARLPNAGLYADLGVTAAASATLLRQDQLIGRLNIVAVGAPRTFTADELALLQALAHQAALAIDNARLFLDLQQSNLDLTSAYDTTLEGWSRALDLRDHETEGHTRRVTELTLRLAEAMGLLMGSPDAPARLDRVTLRRGALLHDIGKMGIPDSILLKPGPLTDSEWVIMRQHPVYAYDLLRPIEFLRPALDIPLRHHEKWDGSGYPGGLRGEAIPLAARLFAVVDVWDALTMDRPYRSAWTPGRVLDYVQAGAGAHFDPAVVSALCALLRSTVLAAEPLGVVTDAH